MSSLDAAVVDVIPEPKQTKRERSKEPQALTKQAISLEYRAELQKDVTTRVEWSSALTQTVRLLDEVKEVISLKTREALPERIESNHGKPLKVSEAKRWGKRCDTGDAKRHGQSPAPLTKDQTLTALQLYEEVKRSRT
uniref:Uncharacterized protein n=1 Tax=Ananas comosus var. bracteatus TaxID=296719 RepID=A0A6V7QLL5_ANACO|nr:unnamed protein product [Ananas comosus var. bracteatus]